MEEVYAALVRSRQALNPLVLARMMHHQLTAGNITRTRNLLYEMYQRGFNCDVAVQMVTHLLQLKEMWAQCDELLIDLRKRNVRLTSRCDLSNCYLHMVPYWAARKETHARCVAYMLELPEHTLSIFNAWLAELAQRGDVLACINAMREMRAHNHKPNLDSYCALFHAAANAQLRGAQDSLFEGMVNDKVEPNAKVCDGGRWREGEGGGRGRRERERDGEEWTGWRGRERGEGRGERGEGRGERKRGQREGENVFLKHGD